MLSTPFKLMAGIIETLTLSTSLCRYEYLSRKTVISLSVNTTGGALTT